MRYDDNASDSRVIETGQNQSIEALIDEFDLFDVSGVLEIQRVVKDDQVSAASSEDAVLSRNRLPGLDPQQGES